MFRKHLSVLGLVLLLAVPLLQIGVDTKEVNAQLPPGISRGDTLIVQESGYGRVLAPTDYNIWRPGVTGAGLTLMLDTLWAMNMENGTIIGILADGLWQFNENYTTMRVRVKQGVYWSDGVEFTAEDVAFTVNLHKKVTGLTWSSYANTWVQSCVAEDKYTVLFTFTKPAPKFTWQFTTQLIGGLLIMPKHIWETKENPLTYTFYPPVGTSAYRLYDYDPQGYWFLLVRRDDWARSALGKAVGKPKPKYILMIYYGTAEKTMIAMSKHELDWGELGYELFDAAKAQNPYIQAFYADFPYCWLSGICDHGVVFNNALYPFNITDVRWALALAINMTEVDIGALNGMGRMAAFRSISVDFIEPFYRDELLPWIKNFSLPDGFKPFDDTIPDKVANWVKSKGYTLPAPAKTIYGQGWWKYDAQEAAKLLQSKGFTKDAGGKWHLPNGDLWTVTFSIPGAWHTLANRIGFGVYEQWVKFGINVVTETPEASIYWADHNTGNFQAKMNWPLCQYSPDPWAYWDGALNSKYYKPLGTLATSNQIRYNNSAVDALLNELGNLPSTDPKVKGLVINIFKNLTVDMPLINCFLGSKLLCSDNYVWTNFPTGQNRYAEPCYWSTIMTKVWVLPNLNPTGNLPSEYTKAAEEELAKSLSESITKIASTVTALNQTTYVLQTSITSLGNQMTTMTQMVAAQAVIVVVLLVVIIIRKK